VPPGSSPRGVSVPASTEATTRTVPSPPSGHTIVAPCPMASLVWPSPGSSAVVSIQMGSDQPASRHSAVTCSFSARGSGNLTGLTMTAIRRTSSMLAGSGPVSLTGRSYLFRYSTEPNAVGAARAGVPGA